MKLYKLYVAKPLLLFYLVMFAALILAAIALIVISAAGKFGSEGPPPWLFVVMLVFVVFSAYMWLRFPFEIKVRDDSMIEFRSIFRRITLSPMDIRSVRAKRYALGFVDVLHQRGTVHLLNHMDGFHEFLFTLKSLNPSITIQGC
jgi:hypothetical protein